MRFASIVVGLLIVGGVQAQGTSSRLWGGTPRDITFTPIDTTRAVTPNNVNKAFHRPGNAMVTNASAASFFPMISLGSWPPPIPQVSILPTKQNPFQPNPPKGGVNLSTLKPPTAKK